jgi:cation:H+ antiporter
MIVLHLGFIAFALLLLFAGAESLVKGSVSLARKAGLSSLVVGLTVVAFGTSSPELVVSIQAALAQQGDISVGNVVGSNSMNIGVILGLTALICPIPVHQQVIRVDAPIALGVALLLPFLLADSTLGRAEGSLLLVGLLAYVWMNLVLARGQSVADSQENSGRSLAGQRWMMDVAFILVGLGILVLGSHLLVNHSVALARAFGVSEAVIGLTIIAAGTSLPELATSVVAALRKQPDLAIGNVVGSNVFNILGILGVASLIAPLHAPGVSLLDCWVVVLFSVLLIPLLYTGRFLHRVEGAALFALYGMYLFMLWP